MNKSTPPPAVDRPASDREGHALAAVSEINRLRVTFPPDSPEQEACKAISKQIAQLGGVKESS